MRSKDEEEVRIDETRNELEGYLFKMMNGLNRDFPEYFDPKKKDDYMKKVVDIQMWFSDNEFEWLKFNDYDSKLNELKVFGEPAIKRREFYNSYNFLVEDLKKRAAELRARIDSKDDNFKHITDEDRDPTRKEIDKFVDWLNKKVESIENSPRHTEISFTREDTDRRMNELNNKVQVVLCKPKPPPPPKPEPKPEAEVKETADGVDGTATDAAKTESNEVDGKPAETTETTETAVKTEDEKPIEETVQTDEQKPVENTDAPIVNE
jgi:hypothetical protein